MRTRFKYTVHLTAISACSVILALFLAACSTTTADNTTATPVATSPASTPVSSSGSPTASGMTMYTGNGFTMSYPQTWQIARSGDHLITFTDGTGTIRMSITVVPNPMSVVTATTLVQTGLKAASGILSNSQTEQTPGTATINGVNWSQASVTGQQRVNDRGTETKVVVLATVHPTSQPSSKGYTIAYRAPKASFEQANTTNFQPMLQSFKFT